MNLEKKQLKKKLANSEAQRVREVSERVALEISFRLSSTMARLKAASIKYGDRLEPETQQAIVHAFEPLSRPATDENPPLYPEYKSYSGIALVAELRRHVGKGEQDNLTGILKDTSGFIAAIVGDKSHPDRPVNDIASDLLRTMKYPRWNENGFPYTDCYGKEPFC